jgi:cobalt/nickel transport system permease protein
MNREIPSFLQTNEDRGKSISGNKRNALPFVDKTLKNVAGFIKAGYVQNDTASINGLLQNINPLVKVVFLLFFIVVINLVANFHLQLLVSMFILMLYLLSKLRVLQVYKKILILSFYFGLLIVLPAALNIFTKGDIIYELIGFEKHRQFWIYHLPAKIGITLEGCWFVARFFLKVANSIALTFLVVHTTSFNHIIKSLKIFKVPDIFLLVITLTYKFIFILSYTTEETYMALKTRWWGRASKTSANDIVAGRIAYIFRKSWLRYEEVYLSMVARGYTGNVSIVDNEKLKWGDVVFLCVIVLIGVGVCLLNYCF